MKKRRSENANKKLAKRQRNKWVVRNKLIFKLNSNRCCCFIVIIALIIIIISVIIDRHCHRHTPENTKNQIYSLLKFVYTFAVRR